VSDLVTLLPLACFLLVPVWIPVLASAIGAVRDRLRPPTLSTAQAAVEKAKRRAEEARLAVIPASAHR
jgi:hypothetical protein